MKVSPDLMRRLSVLGVLGAIGVTGFLLWAVAEYPGKSDLTGSGSDQQDLPSWFPWVTGGLALVPGGIYVVLLWLMYSANRRGPR